MDRRVRFLANVCHECKSKSTPVTCGVCHMVFYCSVSHRRQNWFDHSQLCWALRKISESSGCSHVFQLFNNEDFTLFKHKIANKCTELLKRNLKSWELEIIYHPRVCNVCNEFNWEKLKKCNNCEFVYTCEKNHFRKDHKKWCKIMKLYSDINTQDVEKINSDYLSIKLNLSKIHQKSMAALLTKTYEKEETEKAFASEVLTYPLTVLSCVLSMKTPERREVTIVFIGAEVQAEVEPLQKWENYLLHFLENVDKLNLVFLGPELVVDSHERTLHLCDTCRSKNKSLKCEFVGEKFYHDYTPGNNSKIDLICALNSGMYREFGFSNENSWQKTIPKLFARGAPPVLITEYTCHELKMDLEKIQRLCGNVGFVCESKLNPFASLKPGLNIISGNDVPVIFKNYYYVILKGS